MRTQASFARPLPLRLALAGLALSLTPACISMEKDVQPAIDKAVAPVQTQNKRQEEALNRIDQSLKTIQTSQSNLRRQLEAIQASVTDLKGRVDKTDMGLSSVRGELAKVKTDVQVASELAQRVQKNEESIGNVGATITGLNNKFGTIEAGVKQRQDQFKEWVTKTLDTLFSGLEGTMREFNKMQEEEGS